MPKETKLGRQPIEITDKIISEVETLAELGFNEKQISEAIGMAYSSFQKYKKYFRESLKKGKSKLKVRITSKLLEKIDEGSETSLIFACKRLNLFQPNMQNSKPPKTITEAVAQLSEVYTATTTGELTEFQGEKYSAMLGTIIKSLEVVELEKRIQKLEELKNEKLI